MSKTSIQQANEARIREAKEREAAAAERVKERQAEIAAATAARNELKEKELKSKSEAAAAKKQNHNKAVSQSAGSHNREVEQRAGDRAVQRNLEQLAAERRLAEANQREAAALLQSQEYQSIPKTSDREAYLSSRITPSSSRSGSTSGDDMSSVSSQFTSVSSRVTEEELEESREAKRRGYSVFSGSQEMINNASQVLEDGFQQTSQVVTSAVNTVGQGLRQAYDSGPEARTIGKGLGLATEVVVDLGAGLVSGGNPLVVPANIVAGKVAGEVVEQVVTSGLKAFDQYFMGGGLREEELELENPRDLNSQIPTSPVLMEGYDARREENDTEFEEEFGDWLDGESIEENRQPLTGVQDRTTIQSTTNVNDVNEEIDDEEAKYMAEWNEESSKDQERTKQSVTTSQIPTLPPIGGQRFTREEIEATNALADSLVKGLKMEPDGDTLVQDLNEEERDLNEEDEQDLEGNEYDEDFVQEDVEEEPDLTANLGEEEEEEFVVNNDLRLEDVEEANLSTQSVVVNQQQNIGSGGALQIQEEVVLASGVENTALFADLNDEEEEVVNREEEVVLASGVENTALFADLNDEEEVDEPEVNKTLSEADRAAMEAIKMDVGRKEIFAQVQAIFDDPENERSAEQKQEELSAILEGDAAKEMAEKDSSFGIFSGIVQGVIADGETDPEEKGQFLGELMESFDYLAKDIEKEDGKEDLDKTKEGINLLAVFEKHQGDEKFGHIVQDVFRECFKESVKIIEAPEAALTNKPLTQEEQEEADKKKPLVTTQPSDKDSETEKDPVKKEKFRSSLEDVTAKDIGKGLMGIGTVIALSIVFPGVGTLIGMALVGGVYVATAEKNTEKDQEPKVKDPKDQEQELKEKAKVPVKIPNSTTPNVSAETAQFVEKNGEELKEQKTVLTAAQQKLLDAGKVKDGEEIVEEHHHEALEDNVEEEEVGIGPERRAALEAAAALGRNGVSTGNATTNSALPQQRAAEDLDHTV